MTISSLIIECAPEACNVVAAELSARDGVEVHGVDDAQGKVVVTVEADGIDESHRIASDFASNRYGPRRRSCLRQFRRRQLGEVGLPMTKERRGCWTAVRRAVQIVVAILFFVPLFAAGWGALGLGFSSPEEPLATPSEFAWWGSLSSSHVFGLDVLDPFAALQVAAATKSIASPGLAWVLPVIVVYGVVRGRAFCGWACPVNPAVRVR